MKKDSLHATIEHMLRLPPRQAAGRLPRVFEAMRPEGMAPLLAAVPDLMGRLLEKLESIETGGLGAELHAAWDPLLDFFWRGVGLLAEKSEPMQVLCNQTRKMTVNWEASDSPFRGHCSIKAGGISGGAGLLPFQKQDFRIFGPTAVLLVLLRGELALGFGHPQLQTEGHPGWVPLLEPVVQGMARLVRGDPPPQH